MSKYIVLTRQLDFQVNIEQVIVESCLEHLSMIRAVKKDLWRPFFLMDDHKNDLYRKLKNDQQ